MEPSLQDLADRVSTPDVQLERVLAQMARDVEGLRALVIGDASGLPVASLIRGAPAMATTAMATLALTAATKVTGSLGLGKPDDILIEAGPWIVIVRALGKGFTLSGVFPAAGNLGLVRLAMRTHAREIEELLEHFR